MTALNHLTCATGLHRINQRKESADKLSKIYQEIGWTDRAEKIHRCSLMMNFKVEQVSPIRWEFQHNGSSYYCKDRLCPVCSHVLAVKRREWLELRLSRLMSKGYKIEMLTLTQQQIPVEDFKLFYKQLSSAWERLRKMSNFPAVGFYRKFEITPSRSKENYIHPHAHILLVCESDDWWRESKQWRQMWAKALKVDYLPIVNIRVVNLKSKYEMTKYVVKPLDLEKPEFIAAIRPQLDHLRLTSSGGLLKGWNDDQWDNGLEQNQRGSVVFGYWDYSQNSYIFPDLNLFRE